MGIFNKKNGGLMDQIRCDETSYLIWKWYPKGTVQGNNNRENAIRWGSSLRVKEGEVAAFIYNQQNENFIDYIEGPYDEIVRTKNFPVLASIVGLAYDKGTPFQAEVYYINQAKVIQIPFGIPFFDVFDPRFIDFGVPTAVRGMLTFNITNYREFIKLNRLVNFALDDFQNQIKSALSKYVKAIVTNIPEEKNIPVIQIERKISMISELIEEELKVRLEKDFGITVNGVDVNSIEIDKTSEGYIQLCEITKDITGNTVKAQSEMNIKTVFDKQRINIENEEETLRNLRNEAQYAQHKQIQTSNMGAFQLEQQAAVGIAGAEALGQMGANGGTEISGSGGMNPASLMTGMAMGGVLGQNMAGMMNGMLADLNSSQPPIPPLSTYHVVVNGQSQGPYDINSLSQMRQNGMFSKDSFVWKQGMNDWVKAESVQELSILFGSTPPPVPNIPPVI